MAFVEVLFGDHVERGGVRVNYVLHAQRTVTVSFSMINGRPIVPLRSPVRLDGNKADLVIRVKEEIEREAVKPSTALILAERIVVNAMNLRDVLLDGKTSIQTAIRQQKRKKQ